MLNVLQDLKYALRQVRREPAFFLLAATTLALGIGTNAAIFSVVDAVLLRPLPYEEPDRLVRIWSSQPSRGQRFLEHSYADYEAFRDQGQAFEGVAAFSLVARDFRDELADPRRVETARVTPDFFSVIGVEPVRGRGFLIEAPSSGKREVILSHRFWQQRYGGRDDAIGQQVHVEDEPHTIVGVMGKAFSYPAETALWRRFDARDEHDDDRELQVLARLVPGVSAEEASASVRVIAERRARDFPDTNEGYSAWVQPLHVMLVRDVRTPLIVFLAAVAAVLLIACANVANLQLARGARRRTEMAIRAALGAERLRLVRQLLTENLVLAALGVLGGLFLGNWLLRTLLTMVPVDLPRRAEVALDLRIVVVMVGVTTLAGLVFGWIPALAASRANPQAALIRGGRALLAIRHRLQQGFVVAQVALATALVMSAGLLITSFTRQLDVDRGFERENLVAVEVSHPEHLEEVTQLIAFYENVAGKIRGLAGVTSVVLSSAHPMQTVGFRMPFERQDGEKNRAVMRSVEPGFFRVSGMALLAGRDLSHEDSEGVVVVNQAFVRAFLEGDSALGQRLRHPAFFGEGYPVEHEIVGVVADVRPDGVSEALPQLYFPYRQVPWPNMQVLLRTPEEPARLAAAIRSRVWEIDAHVPVEIRSLEEIVAETVAASRFHMRLGAFFALLALALAAVGIYGVMSYAVTQRTAELGLRVALGAENRDLVAMVMGRGLKLTLLGLAIGLAGAFWAARWLRSLLFGVTASDPVVLALVVLVLGAVSLAACWVPSKRALGVEPMAVLRLE